MLPWPEYKEIITKVPIVCIDVAIYYQGEILLIRRADEPAKGEWWLPGGRLFKGERFDDCALRKAVQETGLTCHYDDIIHFDNTIFKTGPGDLAIHSINFCARLWTHHNEVRLDDTCLDYKWVSGIDDDYHPYIKRCLGRALFYYD